MLKQENINLNTFEKKAWENNSLVCGIDEVGRGSLAGPVVVGAVILPINGFNSLIKDSKTLSEGQREKAYKWIKNNCLYSTATTSHNVVDKVNVYQATMFAMKKTLIQIIESNKSAHNKIKYVLIDAMPLKLEPPYQNRDLEILSFKFGESISSSIAAASIIAKVTRDAYMTRFSKIFPSFRLEKNKGYGTKIHVEVLGKKGPSIIHRKTFNVKTKCRCDGKQQSIF
jgi:ribonuclease HII